MNQYMPDNMSSFAYCITFSEKKQEFFAKKRIFPLKHKKRAVLQARSGRNYFSFNTVFRAHLWPANAD